MGREKDKVAVRTQVLCIISVAQSGFRVGYPREENVSLQCHVPEWGNYVRLMLQCETAIRV
jgi:hypothetical protein